MAAHAAAPPCDGNPATASDRPFTVGGSFLLDGFGRAHGPDGAVYRDTARAWFRCVTLDFPSAAARAGNRIDGRIAQGLNNLGAWDTSLAAATRSRRAAARRSRPCRRSSTATSPRRRARRQAREMARPR